MKITLSTLEKMRQNGQKIVMITAYDATFAQIVSEAGVDLILVGDSLGHVIQGKDSTLPVTLEQMIYHTRCVARAANHAMVMADMPFGTFQISPEKTFEHAAKLMAAGAQMVKIEGGSVMKDTVHFLVSRGIPVCAHIGLQAQSVHLYGGYRVQGKTEEGAATLLADAHILKDAGASVLLMELMPAELAQTISEVLPIPTIGIGAGPNVGGQVLVLHDMLGLTPGKKRFVRNFMSGCPSIQAAIQTYVHSVRNGEFPTHEHSF